MRHFCISCFAAMTAIVSAINSPLAAPVAVWSSESVTIPWDKSAIVDIQSLMKRSESAGVLWIQDEYLTTKNAAERYPQFFGSSDSGSEAALPNISYVAGRNLFKSMAELPESVRRVEKLQDISAVSPGETEIYNVKDADKGWQQSPVKLGLEMAAVVVLSGSVSNEAAISIAVRRLQTEGGGEQPGERATTVKDGLHLHPQDLPALFYLAFFIGVSLLGLSMLHAIDGPVAFEDKLLQINKEY